MAYFLGRAAGVEEKAKRAARQKPARGVLAAVRVRGDAALRTRKVNVGNDPFGKSNAVVADELQG